METRDLKNGEDLSTTPSDLSSITHQTVLAHTAPRVKLSLDQIWCWRSGRAINTSTQVLGRGGERQRLKKSHSKSISNAVLRGISLTVYDGELLVLVGPSGSGKTTALRVIAGFEEQCRGALYLEGELMQGEENGEKLPHTPPEHRGVGFVFQEYALFPHLTVVKNIEFGLSKWEKVDRINRRRQLIELVDLEGLEDRYPHQLSGGQQQRVALARALAPRPKVLLLDEPFSHLDASLRSGIRERLIYRLRGEGVTMIWVTHDQREALSIADRVAVLERGELIACDTPQAVYQTPPTPDVANLLGEIDWFYPPMKRGLVQGPLSCLMSAHINEEGGPQEGGPQEGGPQESTLILGVRPHQWKISRCTSQLESTKGEGLQGGLQGVITQVIFEGERVRLTVEITVEIQDKNTLTPPKQINAFVHPTEIWTKGEIVSLSCIGQPVIFLHSLFPEF